MAKKAEKPERIILLAAGESGSGKSFFVANLKNARIYDTDIGGGLSYAEARIRRNGSERIEVGSYLEVLEDLQRNREVLRGITTLAIDHLSTLHQEAVIRHNPKMSKDFGAAGDKAAREWRKVRELVRWGDFHLVCTSHLKGKWEEDKVVGDQADASKKIEGDFSVVLHLRNTGACGRGNPELAKVFKWRRDPEDPRGRVPQSFPFTVDEFVRINGADFGGSRQEVELASPEQLAEIARLLEVVKVAEDWQERVFRRAKVEAWTDMPAEAVASCLSYLQNLVSPNKIEGAA